MKNVKRTVIALVLALAVAFALCACGEKPSPEPEPEPKTYTADENYALFKAGIDYSMAYDGAYAATYYSWEKDAAGEDGEKRIVTVDGTSGRLFYDYATVKNENLQPSRTIATKPVDENGHTRYKYYEKDVDEETQESCSYVRRGVVFGDSLYNGAVNSYGNLPSKRKTDIADGNNYADFEQKMKSMWSEEFAVEDDKVSVSIVRASDDEVTVTLTIEYVTVNNDEDDEEEGDVYTGRTAEWTETFTVSGGKLVGITSLDKGTDSYKSGKTEETSSGEETVYKYEFDEELYSGVDFDSMTATNEEYVALTFMYGEYTCFYTVNDYKAAEPMSLADIKATIERKGRSGFISGNGQSCSEAYDLYLDEDFTEILTDGYVPWEDMTVYVKLNPVAKTEDNGGVSFICTVAIHSDGLIDVDIDVFYFGNNESSVAHRFTTNFNFGAGGVTFNGTEVTDFVNYGDSGVYEFEREIEPGNIYTVIRKS